MEYLAWQQTRSATDPFGDFELRRDADELFGDNIFLIKVSYGLNP